VIAANALHRADRCRTIVPTAEQEPAMIASLPWSEIDTVLLDMDGTLLDLHFDNHFCLDLLPQRYAERHGISRAMAELELAPLFNEHEGKLTWYCLDFWTRELNLPIREMKREIADLIALRPAADEFLAALRDAGKRVVLITNAHRDSLSLKLERIELAPWFNRLISSHDYGFPKEQAQFWHALKTDLDFNPATALFIDDSLSVLRSARAYGIAHLLAISEPDSRRGRKDTEGFTAVDDYLELIRSQQCFSA
jgi:putative hydrolase of the HAD superfamily